MGLPRAFVPPLFFSVLLEDEAVVDALGLVVFQGREIGVGRGLGVVEQGLGELLKLGPAVPFEGRRVGDLPEE